MFDKNLFYKIVDGKYTNQDAFLEIFLMVFVSFILGFFIGFLWAKFFTKEKENILEKKVFEKEFKNKKSKKEKKDNLRLIEGVGPKIESLLERNQITTFEKISKMSTEDLKKVLDQAGSRYAFHNPKTWPEQAKLAYEKKWDELAKLQDFLNGGKTF